MIVSLTTKKLLGNTEMIERKIIPSGLTNSPTSLNFYVGLIVPTSLFL